ncbi:MAG TPA: DUF1361 domain-containing protein [Anaeromyxobacter sp.]|nr:DUF1361 domain-containing protein [Anaeromyxobacter sp.]
MLDRSLTMWSVPQEHAMPDVSSPGRVRPPAHPRGRTAAVVAASALALAMWAYRWRLAGPDLEYLAWNLVLAWIPWLAARAVARARSALSCAAIGAVWLAFLPNAPYLVTDLVHLRPRPPVPTTFDVLLFASFALAGCALAWGSLDAVHARLARALGRARAAVAIAAVLLLTGFGVYLGRFERWNSWDLVARPRGVLADAAGALADPHALAFSALFAAFVGAGYLLLSPPRRAEALDRES